MKRGPQNKTKVVERPDLMQDWDEVKNARMGLDPARIVVGSTIRVWWKCHVCGKEWESAVRGRTKAKCGCPECARKEGGASRIATTIARKGSFSDVELLKDWDYERNKQGPELYSPVSNKFVYWKCHVCGYRWTAKISNRVNGRGCAACSGKALHVGHNDLATTEPELAKEWHPTKNGGLRPCDVTRGQSRKVWWLCPNGHPYQASPNKRSSDHTGCPICNSGRQTSFREQAFCYYIRKIWPSAVSRYKPDWIGRMELDIFIPELNLAIEYDGAAWHKTDALEREHRKYEMCQEHGIRLWRVKEVSPKSGWGLADQIFSVPNVETKDGFKTLLLSVVSALDPECNIWTKSNPLKVWTDIDIDPERDRYAINQYRYAVRDSLLEKRPDLAVEWHPTNNPGWKPEGLSWKSERKVWWLCSKCGTEYEMTVAHRVTDNGCPHCAKEKFALTYRENRIAKSGALSDPELLAEWNSEKNIGMMPSDFTPGCADKVWWKCRKCGYEWEAKIANRSHGRGCPCCANRVVVKGKNDLATLYPEIAAEWDYERNESLMPDQIAPGKNGKVWWVCSKCGHRYQAPPNRRTSQGSGCRKCADKLNGLKHRKKKDVVGQLTFDFG